jgi:undecaprenyl diphosphate synthase
MSASQAETPPEIPLQKVPHHVGIIMDGNGRWAQARGLPRSAGHHAGTENLHTILRAAAEFGVRVLTLYAFSTENWSRPDWEVRGLLTLLEHVIDSELDDLNANGVRICHLGRTEGLAPSLVKKIAYAQEYTQHNERLLLNVAFNYGGRADIVDAVRQIVAEGLSAEQITEEAITRHLVTCGTPDPDLIIRTAGEMRLSNFLIWQAAYAEYYSTPIYWPDFDRQEFYKALLAYQQRDRRFGQVKTAST